jgi:dipeptidyl aminopeptidase/acylaminoacyl peptidase
LSWVPRHDPQQRVGCRPPGWRWPAGAALAAAALGCSAGTGTGPGAAESVAPAAAALESAAGKAAAKPLLGSVAQRLDARNVSRTAQRNEAHPRFSPDGSWLSFETREGSAQAIFLARVDDPARPLQRVSSAPPGPAAGAAEDALLGLAGRDESYNAELSFGPAAASFVFTGNGNRGMYRLYEGRVGEPQVRVLTSQATEDGHPSVSPDGRWLAYVSAREGTGKLILRALASGEERPLTDGPDVDLYPAWSADSRSIAFTSGTNDDHNVFVVRDVGSAAAAPIALTRWNFDDLRPVFSPDGRSIAFYSNFSPDGELDQWSILVVPADGSGPDRGLELGERVVATAVVQDLAVGPAWLPWGHALVYARHLPAEWNPIYVVDASTREERRIETTTRMNHDVTCSANGWVAFRAQVQSWDDVFVAPLVEVPR